MEGTLVVDPRKESFHCFYFEHAGESRVMVPSSSLLEYSTRTGASLFFRFFSLHCLSRAKERLVMFRDIALDTVCLLVPRPE